MRENKLSKTHGESFSKYWEVLRFLKRLINFYKRQQGLRAVLSKKGKVQTLSLKPIHYHILNK